MRSRMLCLAALSLATVLPGVALADRDHDDKWKHKEEHGRWAVQRYDDDCRVYVAGHYEERQCTRVIPAVTRQEWVPDRCEVVVIPAVTERVWVPPVVERVWCPEVRERVWCPGRFEFRWDSRGGAVRVEVGGHYEDRVVRPGRYEERVVSPGHYEDRVVCAERRESRVVECGHFRTVVVCPERRVVDVERVWVPGHYEDHR